MTFQSMRFSQGDEVIVLDTKGQYECRGKIVGRSDSMRGVSYDVQPNRAESLAKRICGLPETRLRNVPKEVRAYEKVESEPRHVLDDA